MTKSTFNWLRLLLWLAIIGGYIFISKNYLFDFASTLEVEVIKAQIGILVNVSAILFGVIGAWLALIYPTALQKIQGNNSVDLAYRGVDLDILKNLVVVLLFSTASLILSMLTDLSLTLSKHPFVISTIDKRHIIAMGAIVVWFLFIIQITAITSLLTSSFRLVYDLFVSKAFSDLENLLKRKKSK
ncbi:hypothetical protein [Aliivibrio fischeri]|uniref:hypothetical protein n=1 Tax=Aliivibrio fischeri TaxID=668 RepID=UPI0012DAC0E7|nr:hypothetical protein [Aliivibrio fischeri]MUJ23589.1 hypothetical protein [Aliivibrio fischeri]